MSATHSLLFPQVFKVNRAAVSNYYDFEDTVLASTIRLQVDSFTGRVCVKMELYGCSAGKH